MLKSIVSNVLVCATVCLATGAASATTFVAPFSPAAVFALPYHRDIPDDCKDARTFVDAANKSVDALGAADVLRGASSLMSCVNAQRLNPDPDEQRYLALAAATALYLAASKSDGPARIRFYQNADAICAQLGAPTPDGYVKILTQNVSNVSGYIENKQVITYDRSGGPTHLLFADVAENLRQNIEVRIAAPDAASSSAPGAVAPGAPAASAAPIAPSASASP